MPLLSDYYFSQLIHYFFNENTGYDSFKCTLLSTEFQLFGFTYCRVSHDTVMDTSADDDNTRERHEDRSTTTRQELNAAVTLQSFLH